MSDHQWPAKARFIVEISLLDSEEAPSSNKPIGAWIKDSLVDGWLEDYDITVIQVPEADG